MFKNIILLLLLGHVIGDFYTQSRKMSDNKEKRLKWVVLHGIVYFIMMILVSVPIMSNSIFITDIAVSIMHLLIDVAKFVYIKAKKRKIDEKRIFIIDQGMHIVCLMITAYIAVKMDILLVELEPFKDFFSVLIISEINIVKWVLALLIIHKPTNILIQKLTKEYKPAQSNQLFKRDNNAGRFIGSIERIVMLVLISLGQYSAIGFVLTAKSIARYDRISKDKEFAEYYLLGTLISTMLVLICGRFLL